MKFEIYEVSSLFECNKTINDFLKLHKKIIDIKIVPYEMESIKYGREVKYLITILYK